MARKRIEVWSSEDSDPFGKTYALVRLDVDTDRVDDTMWVSHHPKGAPTTRGSALGDAVADLNETRDRWTVHSVLEEFEV